MIIESVERQQRSLERERQRFAHLVLELPRPKLDTPTGKRKSRRAAPVDVVLVPGVEERVALRERWSHKANGTPETHEFADRVRRRAGSLARLHASGTITANQLGAAQEIAETYEAIVAAVAIKSSFGLDRVDGGYGPGAAGAAPPHVERQLTYDRWRASIEGPVAAVLAMVVDDVGLTIAARQFRMSDRRTRAVLIEALDRWNTLRGRGAYQAPRVAAGG